MKRLIILLMLLVPVSLIAKDVGWTIDKNTKTEMTLNLGAQHNYAEPFLMEAKAEPLNVLLISVPVQSPTWDVLLFDKFEKPPTLLYFKPPLLNLKMRYNKSHYKISFTSPESYPKRI